MSDESEARAMDAAWGPLRAPDPPAQPEPFAFTRDSDEWTFTRDPAQPETRIVVTHQCGDCGFTGDLAALEAHVCPKLEPREQWAIDEDALRERTRVWTPDPDDKDRHLAGCIRWVGYKDCSCGLWGHERFVELSTGRSRA